MSTEVGRQCVKYFVLTWWKLQKHAPRTAISHDRAVLLEMDDGAYTTSEAYDVEQQSSSKVDNRIHGLRPARN